MKKLNTLFFFLLIAVGHLCAADDSKKPILRTFTLGMTPEEFYSQQNALLEKYPQTPIDHMGTYYAVAIEGVRLNLETISKGAQDITDIFNQCYVMEFEEDRPLYFCGSPYFIEGKLAALTIGGIRQPDVTIPYILFRNPTKPDAKEQLVCCDFKAHNRAIGQCRKLVEVFQKSFGTPIKTYDIPQMPTQQTVGDQKELSVDYTKTYHSYAVIPFAEFRNGDMQVVIGINSTTATPFIMYYAPQMLAHKYLNEVFKSVPQTLPEITP
uniref:Uncharacterized protein n=1 Tax=Prevotella sp. GTC17262 TaxID=3236797 RepID=A0AB33JNG5_9BACT